MRVLLGSELWGGRLWGRNVNVEAGFVAFIAAGHEMSRRIS